MTSDFNQPEKDEIAREILSYLSEHPGAQDTLEGIVQWWLLERKIKYQTLQVNEAIKDLVEGGLLLKNENNKVYQLNLIRSEEIRLMLEQNKAGKGFTKYWQSL